MATLRAATPGTDAPADDDPTLIATRRSPSAGRLSDDPATTTVYDTEDDEREMLARIEAARNHREREERLEREETARAAERERLRERDRAAAGAGPRRRKSGPNP